MTDTGMVYRIEDLKKPVVTLNGRRVGIRLVRRLSFTAYDSDSPLTPLPTSEKAPGLCSPELAESGGCSFGKDDDE